LEGEGELGEGESGRGERVWKGEGELDLNICPVVPEFLVTPLLITYLESKKVFAPQRIAPSLLVMQYLLCYVSEASLT